MSTLAVIVALCTASPADVEAVRAWDPPDLTTETARANLEAACAAAIETGQDLGVLLFIARHESHFRSNTRTPESGGRESCGVMTPVPRSRCYRQSLANQYLAGARHLAEWYGVYPGDDRGALLGYAGGFRLVLSCAHHPLWRTRDGHRVDLCETWRLYRDGGAAVDALLERAP